VVGRPAGRAKVRVRSADGAEAVAQLAGDGAFALELPTAGLARWRPDDPRLHTVRVTVWQGGALVAQAERGVGLREVRVAEAATWLDERPLHIRGLLDWGWHPDLVRPTPTRAMLERQFVQARSLGFNLIKLCLFVPDETTFDVADELGLLLWLELPMWLPHVTPALEVLARAEYAALLRRLHHHPSLVVVSLGCELNAEASAGFLQELDQLARAWLPNVLHCDNSGSAEAYGGVATATSDFYDYHFYTDPHFFQPLVEHFDRRYRTPKPWLYGEFCDADTGRDFSALDPLPWWLTDPVRLERDDYLHQRAHKERLVSAGLTDGGAALARLGRKQATPIRKYILELTRRHSATGGYVLTGWADTPITTSGMVDDSGRLKFAPDEWQRFNADAVLLLDRERRRRWVGGDRPAYRDPYSWWAGERAELHILLSNGLGAATGGTLRWLLVSAGGGTLAQSQAATGPLPAAQVQELAVVAPTLPAVRDRPAELRLKVTLDLTLTNGTAHTIENGWTLWAVPRPSLPTPLPVAGPLRHDHNFARLAWQAQVVDLAGAPLTQPFVTDALKPEVLERVRAGGYGLWWLRGADDRFTRALPFWREAIHSFADHPLWQRAFKTPPRHADLRFFSVATDFALDLPALQAHLGAEAAITPMWRRFDARQLTWAEYLVAVQYGAGRLFVSSLRFEGGLGSQPAGFEANPWGGWLLAQLLAEGQT